MNKISIEKEQLLQFLARIEGKPYTSIELNEASEADIECGEYWQEIRAVNFNLIDGYTVVDAMTYNE